MIKLQKNGKVKIDIGSFHLNEYLENELIDFLEDFNYGLGGRVPIILRAETFDNEYFFIININELYILDTNNEKISKENISLLEFGRNLYDDILKQQDAIIEYTSDLFENTKEIKEIFSLNLRSLNILLNQEDFSYKRGNLTKNTLDTLNNALYLHTVGCVYDKIENIETFRLFGYDKTYLISITKPLNSKIIQQNNKISLDIINKPLTTIAIEVYNKVSSQKKLQTTKDLLDQLKENLKEYGVDV